MPEKSRLISVDVVKGIAITLVVLGHVIQGLGHRGWLSGPAGGFTDRFIYTFHMPAFFFVSGLFIDQSLARRGSARFASEKFRTIFYPYLLWACITLATFPLTSSYRTTTAPTIKKYFLLVISGGDQSWFLFTLFSVLMLALLTQKIPAVLRLILAILLCLFCPATGRLAVDNVAREFVFVVAGQLVGKKIARLDGIPLWLGILGPVAAFAGIAYGIAAQDRYSASKIYFVFFILFGLAGTLGLFLLARNIKNTRLAEGIAWVGEASIGVYLFHPYFQGGTREILVRLFHTTRAFPHIVVTVAVATLVPAAIYHLRNRLHLGFLFEMPKRSTPEQAAIYAPR